MNAIVWGTRQLFEEAQVLLSNFASISIVTFFELQNQNRTKIIKEIEQMFADQTADSLILAVPNKDADGITALLKGAKVSNVFYIPHYAMDLDQPGMDEILLPVDINKPRLCYMEFHVCDHCNLKCKGCSHYSNIDDEKVFADFNSYCLDLKRLKELFWGIRKVRLMGGEPLLNKELDNFINITRQVFPDADIRIVTNGLQLPGMTQSLAAAMKTNHCGFDITLYGPTHNILGAITHVLDEYGIESRISSDRKLKFRRKITMQPINNPKIAYSRCNAKKCHFLRDGQLATCSRPLLVEKLNNRYLTNFPARDIHNIYDQNIDSWELNRQLNSPIDFCRYCSPYPEEYLWCRSDSSTAQLEDWIMNLPFGKVWLYKLGQLSKSFLPGKMLK